MGKKTKTEQTPLENLPTPTQVDGQPLDASAFKHENGGWQPKATVEDILAKAARGERVTREEVGALRAAGLKKDGSKLVMPTGPKDPLAMNSDKLLGVINLLGVEKGVAMSYDSSNGDEQKQIDLKRSLKALVKRLNDADAPEAKELSTAIVAEIQKHDPKFGSRVGGHGPRGDDFGITTMNRAIVDMSEIGGKRGDRYTRKVIEHEGVKGIFLVLTGESDVDDAEETASPFASADPTEV